MLRTPTKLYIYIYIYCSSHNDALCVVICPDVLEKMYMHELLRGVGIKGIQAEGVIHSRKQTTDNR